MNQTNDTICVNGSDVNMLKHHFHRYIVRRGCTKIKKCRTLNKLNVRRHFLNTYCSFSRHKTVVILITDGFEIAGETPSECKKKKLQITGNKNINDNFNPYTFLCMNKSTSMDKQCPCILHDDGINNIIDMILVVVILS